MQHSWAEGRERKIIWEGCSGFDMTQGSVQGSETCHRKSRWVFSKRPKTEMTIKYNNVNKPPRGQQHTLTPETVARCTPGFAGRESIFTPGLLLFFFVNFLTV